MIKLLKHNFVKQNQMPSEHLVEIASGEKNKNENDD